MLPSTAALDGEQWRVFAGGPLFAERFRRRIGDPGWIHQVPSPLGMGGGESAGDVATWRTGSFGYLSNGFRDLDPAPVVWSRYERAVVPCIRVRPGPLARVVRIREIQVPVRAVDSLPGVPYASNRKFYKESLRWA